MKNFICANPRTIDNESNDCTVRSTSLAFNKPYDEVHRIYHAMGRKPRRGSTIHIMNKVFQSITKDDRVMTRDIYEPTFAQFAKEHPVGKFIVVKRKHAVALIDGVWHDAHVSCVGARSRVLFYYEVK